MFESLKKLFSRPAPPTSYAPYEPPAQSLAAMPPQAPAQPRPAPVAVAPAPPRPPSGGFKPAIVSAQNGEMVNLPFTEIIQRLPATIAPLLVGRANGTFSFPIHSAVEQLGTGAVRVRFLELRRSAPPGTFANDASQDENLIDLPLPQILAAIGPAAFARRSDQRVTAVPDDVTGVFGPKGAASPRIATKPAPVAPPPPAAPARPAPTPPTPAPISHAPAPAPAAPIPQPRSAPAPVPIPVVQPVAPIPVAAAPAAMPKPAPAIRPVTPVAAPKPAAPAPLPFASQKPASPLPFATRPASPPPAPAPVAAPAPVVVPAPTQTGDSPTVVTTIAAVCQLWPDSIHTEIEQFELGGSVISIPLSHLENGMKTGRVVVAWSDVLGWLNPPNPIPSAQGTTELELPLNVIAPLFIAKRRSASAQAKVSVGENIPDLFAGVVKPAAVAPAPAPVVAPPPPPPARAPELSALGRIFGQPTKSEWSPQEIARQISALPGVTGSLLATTDGLLVAGQISPPLTGETLAAFAPQVFGRISSYADEIKLGTVRAVTLTTDSGPCIMLGAGQVYIAVVGKPGQTLPEATLLRIAAELTNLKA